VSKAPSSTRPLRLRALSVVAALAVLLPHAARASDAADEAEIQRGIELRRHGENRDALGAFEHAYALRPSPRALAQIALAHQALGDWIQAEAGLASALAASDDAWIARYRDVLEKALETVREHLGALVVHASAPDAEVIVDDAAEGARVTAEPVRVVAGTRTIQVRAPGREPVSRTVDVPAGAQVEVSVELPPVSAASLATPPGDRAATVAPRRSSALAYVAIGAAGFLTAAGIVAWGVHEHEASIYDDDSRCLQGTATRDQQCGGRAREADVALGVELGAFAGAAAAATYAIVRLASTGAPGATGSRTTPASACAPWLGLGVQCGGRF
jgi:hypothetical protein